MYVTVKARKLVDPRFLPANASIYHSKAVKVQKMLVNASISGFYHVTMANVDIYQHQFAKARFKY